MHKHVHSLCDKCIACRKAKSKMVLVGDSDAARCKLVMSTLTGMAMDWFISLPNGHITSFQQLSQLFREQYLANRAPPPVSYDLFDVKQY